MNFVYVVLHYKNQHVTKECIDSILEYATGDIIVVDNGSNNKSGEALQAIYAKENRVKFIFSAQNVGFAKGNNLGYSFAVQQLHPDFIICLNNDTEINQSNFEALIEDSYQNHRFWILGPDIVNINGNYHQNPITPIRYDEQSLEAFIRMRKKRWRIAQIKQLPMLQSLFARRLQAIEKQRVHSQQHVDEFSDDATLYGACIVYSVEYMSRFSFAFYPETYMYSEEYFLKYLVSSRQGKSIFDPRIVVLHKEHVSTNEDYANVFRRELFMAKNQLQSALTLRELIRKDANLSEDR